MPFDLVLRGGRVIDPSQKLDAVTDVAFAAGKVVRVGNELSVDPGTDVRDVSGYIVTPGRRARDCCGPPHKAGAPPRRPPPSLFFAGPPRLFFALRQRDGGGGGG